MALLMVFFGYAFVVAMAAAILVPYLRGKSDLMTSWNLFLLGSLNYVGCGAVFAGQSSFRLGWYDDDDRLKFVLGAIVCYAALFASYYALRIPRRLAGRHLNKWPPFWGIPLAVLIAICLLLTIGGYFTPNIQGVGQIIAMVGSVTPVLIVAYLFMLWLDRPNDPGLIVLLSASVVLALVVALTGTITRRNLLSVAMTFPVCLYWLRLRYSRASRSLAMVGVLGLLTMILIAGWTAIRFQGTTSIVGRVEGVVSSGTSSGSRLLGLFNGDAAAECACLAIHRYTHDSPPEPFFTIKYVLSNPVPRAFWRDKPKALGETLPHDLGVWKRGYVNWGPCIVGHGFHEGGAVGGYFMLVFYAVLFGGAMRFFDELIRRQPNNPYLIATLGATSSQVIAFSRGDIGYFCVMILGVSLTGLLVPLFIRLFSGTGFRYPKAGEEPLPDAAPYADTMADAQYEYA